MTGRKNSPDSTDRKLYKVRVPTTRVISYRRVEEGMVLAGEVSNENGQMLYPAETELTPEKIRRLQRFGVRSIPVREYEERWVDEPEYREFPAETPVVETAESPSSEDLTRESEGPPSKLFELFDHLQNVESADSLLNLLRTVSLRGEGPEPLEAELETLRDRGQDLGNQREYLLAQIANVEEPEERLGMLRGLLGFEGDEEFPDASSNLPGELLADFHELLQERSQLKNDLLDLVNQHLHQLDLEEVPPEPISTGGDGPDLREETRRILSLMAGAGETSEPSLQSDLRTFLDTLSSTKFEGLRDALQQLHESSGAFSRLSPEEQELLDRIAGVGETGSGETAGPPDPRSLQDALDLFLEEDWHRGIQVLEEQLPDSNPLSGHARTLDELLETRGDLETLLEESVEDEQRVERLVEKLEGGNLGLGDLALDTDAEVPPEVLEQLEGFLGD